MFPVAVAKERYLFPLMERYFTRHRIAARSGSLQVLSLIEGAMKKLLMISAAVLAATLLSGGAFAVPHGAAKALSAPSAVVKIHYGCGRAHYRRPCHRCGCSGYYTPSYVYSSAPCGGYSGCGCSCGCGGWSCGCGGWGWGGGFLGGFFGW
jgi:hypothetical protein